ncbi:hypothetical protein ACFPRL_04095 [Pseudoclavibacter helvolus]
MLPGLQVADAVPAFREHLAEQAEVFEDDVAHDKSGGRHGELLLVAGMVEGGQRRRTLAQRVGAGAMRA